MIPESSRTGVDPHQNLDIDYLTGVGAQNGIELSHQPAAISAISTRSDVRAT